MITDLAHKAVNEKYFKSIRYFSHLLNGAKRFAFISELSNHNIYLSAQCLMSAEKIPDLESELKIKSEIFAREFGNIEKSAKGFLALAEFESFETILNLLTSITKPSKTHLFVFYTILSESDSSVFTKFFEVILKTKHKKGLSSLLISAYNKQLIVSAENKIQLKFIIINLLENKYYGILKIFLEKFELLTEISFILDKNINEIINEIISQESYTGIMLAYSLVTENNLFEVYSPTFFIKSLTKKHNKTCIILAMKFCILHNIQSVQEIDTFIIKYTRPGKCLIKQDKFKNVIVKFINSGLMIYAKNNKYLNNIIENFLLANKIIIDNREDIEEIIRNSICHKSDARNLLNSYNNIEDYFNYYFQNKSLRRKIKVEDLIKLAINRFSSSLMEISRILRKFQFTGEIRHKREFGCYIYTKELNTEKLPFIHSSQIFEANSTKTFSDLSEGEFIKFRIIGINKETYRLNASALDQFKI